jgi:hypothetical protein
MRVLINARLTPEPITGESVRVPDSYPFTSRLNEVPDRDADVAISYLEPAQAVHVQNDGLCLSSGVYAGSANRLFVVEIDSAGGVGTATFRWSGDGGSNWEGSGISTSSSTVLLRDGVSVSFGGQSLAVGDRWQFHAEVFTRSSASPSEGKMFYVDFARGYLEFHASDASKVVRATYEGCGSLIDASDINEMAMLLGRAGSFTMSAGSGSTFVGNADILGNSKVLLCPRNGSAAGKQYYVSEVIEGFGFRVTPVGSASGDELFDYVLFG